MFTVSPPADTTHRPATVAEQQRCFSLLSWSLQPDSDPDAFFILSAAIQRWDLFLELVRWHRVGALAWQRLSPLAEQLPSEVAQSLRQAARNTAMQALKLTQELKRVASLLQQQRIDFLVLKGAPLAQQLYGNPGMRFSKDIDILVREEDVERVHILLCENGYRRMIPHANLPAAALSRFKEYCKDYVYRHRDSNCELELHWRLEGNPYFLELDCFQPFRNITTINLAGTDFPILSPQHEALYLIMHAAHSCWGRLSWLNDIAELLRRPLDWNEVLQLAQQCGLTPSVWITVNLAHRLLQAPLPEPLRPEYFPGDISTHVVLRFFLSSTPQPRYASGILNILLTFLFCRQAGFKRHHFIHSFALTLNDIAALPLPRPLHFAYYPLRPALYTWRVIARYAKRGNKP